MEPWQTIMLVGGIVVVCAVALPRKAGIRNTGGDNQTVRNMETALEQFMENMEADNREIAGLVGKSNDEMQAQAAKRDEKVGLLEKRIAELERSLAEHQAQAASDRALEAARFAIEIPTGQAAREPVLQTGMASAAPAVRMETGLIIEEEPSTPSIRSRYAEVFDMHQAGKSVDAIAKKLGRNKGEIQLILQLSKQEEAARHE